MLPLLYHIMSRFASVREQQIILAVDDTPTKRYGKQVEAANVHRNPTAGPADGEWLYGHNWVCLALLLPHRLFGITALPLVSKLYVRKQNIEQLKPKYGWKFRTKHQLSLEIVFSRWAIEETFHDLKEVWGVGEQQVRNIWSSIVCWDLCTWIYTMVELASWDEKHDSIVDRSDCPWDNPNLRPSRRDRKRKIAQEMLQNELLNPRLDDMKS